ncbi:ABC transporter permease [Bogoriella caseilytica]|uniref:ABC-2 type transport system permease protein n=1 Tax=Bogoriella caseilytica TaxID=56055 RepID=A0A3N2BDA5_9MICO|nr:ABC transporter permease [Bogoriella caseilytica]ROR73237.1 ABC-2 type transport system permease protein [Bogoriella caseilytica]
MPDTLHTETVRRPRALTTIRAAGLVAAADMRATHTVFTWSLGWLSRVLVQVVFFAVIGVLLEDAGAVQYLFLGQAVMVLVAELFFAVPSTTWERGSGTLPLLVAAPAALWPVFVGRSLQWLPSGLATSTVALFALGPLFGLTWSLGSGTAAWAVLAVTGMAMYPVALTLAALVLQGPRWRNVVSNVGHTLIMLIAGVTVPTAIWPGWLQAVGQSLPLTHGLQAIRDLEAGVASTASVLTGTGVTLGLGALWLAAAAGLFTIFAERGRRAGSIAFQE